MSDASMPNRLLDLLEVAKRLGISRRSVDRLIANGELAKPVKVRGCSRLFETDLEKYFEFIRRNREQ